MKPEAQAVILAGGLGVRLRPLTYETPKPMAPVAGKPYLEHQLLLLARQETRDVVILTGYLGEQIEDYFRDGRQFGLNIRYSREETPLGTGGAVMKARDLLREDFVVIYGDSYLPIDYALVAARLRENEAAGVLVVYDNRRGDTLVRNNVAVTADGYIRRYAKDTPAEASLTHVDAGVCALSQAALDAWQGSDRFSLESDLYTLLVARRTLCAYETSQRFYDIGAPERLAAFERYLLSQPAD